MQESRNKPFFSTIESALLGVGVLVFVKPAVFSEATAAAAADDGKTERAALDHRTNAPSFPECMVEFACLPIMCQKRSETISISQKIDRSDTRTSSLCCKKFVCS